MSHVLNINVIQLPGRHWRFLMNDKEVLPSPRIPTIVCRNNHNSLTQL